MKIIKPSVEFLGAVPTDRQAALQFIEAAGRTCYRSEDKIAPGTAEPFVRRLIKAGHLAMVEHSNFVVMLPGGEEEQDAVLASIGNYLTMHLDEADAYVGGNLRAWCEMASRYPGETVFWPFARVYGDLFNVKPRIILALSNWQACEPPKELQRYAARFVCDRGVSHELVRHRPCSFAQESTRYVNYCGKDMEFIEPAGFESWQPREQACFYNACRESEERYSNLLMMGRSPQQARAVLPNALKTEIVVTADAAEWRIIRTLRQHPTAHPDMVRLTSMIPWDKIV